MTPDFDWDAPGVLDTLRKMWMSDATSTRIAAVLGCSSRQQVIAKAHRMGLPRRRSVSGGPPPGRRGDGLDVPPDPGPLRRAEPEVPLNGPARVVDLSETRCRWPIGDPLEPDFHFCGRPKPIDGLPYCDEHCRQAYQPRPQRIGTKERARIDAEHAAKRSIAGSFNGR